MSCSGVSEALWVDREGVVLRKRQCTLFGGGEAAPFGGRSSTRRQHLLSRDYVS
jgi:hypothetical protein